MPNTHSKSIDLKKVFSSLQDELLAALKVAKTSIAHPGTQGSVAEKRWRQMFADHLPARYCATDAFVVDSVGRISQQIDLLIYDQQYSPFILNKGDGKYVTAESVYAAFEIKPTLNAATLAYAAKRVESVRTLKRTSAKIAHAGGTYKPKALTHILGGILCRDSSWSSEVAERHLARRLGAMPVNARLDLGCVLSGGSFEATYHRKAATVVTAPPDASLVFFLLRLLARLQEVGTVAAIDLRKYAERL